MYQRIKNKLDLEIVKESLKTEKVEDAVLKRIRELVEVLDRDDAYGAGRKAYDMGGYVLLFTERETYECYISKLMECYHLEKNLSEYTERISGTEDGRAWQEELYLLSSDDALVLVYPAGQE